jgi:hypothetical protein
VNHIATGGTAEEATEKLGLCSVLKGRGFSAAP